MTTTKRVVTISTTYPKEIAVQLEIFNASEPAVQEIIYKKAVQATILPVVIPENLTENEIQLKEFLSNNTGSTAKMIAKICQELWGLKYDAMTAFAVPSTHWVKDKIYVPNKNENDHNYGIFPFQMTAHDSGLTNSTIRFSTLSQGNGIRRENAVPATLEESIAFITKKLLA